MKGLKLWQKKFVEDSEIWYFLFNEYPVFKKKYRNPVRRDKEPGCKFYQSVNGLRFIDYAINKSYSALSMLMEYYNTSVPKDAIFLFLNRNKELKDIPKYVFQKEQWLQKTEIEFFPFTKGEEFVFNDLGARYWKDLGVTKSQIIRPETRVYNLFGYSINGHVFHFDLSFGYLFPDGTKKIYNPLEKESKWFSNTNRNSHWFLKRGGNLLICKSNKDFLVLENLCNWSLICFSNEGIYPTNLKELCSGFDKKLVLFDNDETGIKAGIKVANLIKGEAKWFTDFKDSSEGYLKNKKKLCEELNLMLMII